MTRVAVTGSTGFVGSHVARSFEASGWEVSRLDRPSFDLGNPRPPELASVDILVHCARSMRGDENLAGSRRLFEAARAAGVRSIVFVSSLASGAEAHSAYGREKHAVEQLLDPARDVIIRPGLITGNGGLYASMSAALRRFPFAPLVDRGTQPVYTVRVSSLADAIRDIVVAKGRGLYLLANPHPTTLAQLYADIAASAAVRPRLIPVPYRLLLACARLSEMFHLPIPISAENVRGVRNLRRIEIPRYSEIDHDL